MSDSLRDKRMRSETQISEQLDERLTMNDNKRYYRLILNTKNFYCISLNHKFSDESLCEELFRPLRR